MAAKIEEKKGGKCQGTNPKMHSRKHGNVSFCHFGTKFNLLDREATPPPADPNDDPESNYGKCDLAVDCCNLVNEDKKENEKVECDCAKLLPKMK